MPRRPLPAAALLPIVLLALGALGGCEADPVRPAPRAQPTPALALATAVEPTEADALAISETIQRVDAGTGLRLHLPYGAVVDPIYASGDPASPEFTTVASYGHEGDAAIWTGHYLAAEAFRYKATPGGSADARANLQRALDGIAGLVDVTTDLKPDLLARFTLPATSPYLESTKAHEGHRGVYAGTLNGEAYHWFGETSRDQYSGVMFGLGVAYDMLDPAVAADAAARQQIAGLVTRLLDFLLRNDWNVVMPDGTTSTTFRGRADQQLSFLQVGRRVNPARFDATYKSYRKSKASSVGTPISLECSDPHGSYYKFNLDYINLYNLIRLEEPTSSYRKTYLNAYNTLRGSSCTGTHQNAHFNMVDRALKGASSTRDADTRTYLGLWLTRPRRNYAVDLSAKYPACGDNRACAVIPVDERPNTDFLWQRSPFLLKNAGDGTHATAAIDHILPYWMARYYGVLTA